MSDDDFGTALIEGLEEAVAWKRGELALETVTIDAMPVERVKAIRREVARSARDFERRFGIPAATVSNWEQGRRAPDPAARLLLRLSEDDPAKVERIAHATPSEGEPYGLPRAAILERRRLFEI